MGSQKGPIKGFYLSRDTEIRWAKSEKTAVARERVEGFSRVCSRHPESMGHPADLPQVSGV